MSSAMRVDCGQTVRIAHDQYGEHAQPRVVMAHRDEMKRDLLERYMSMTS